uniref:Ovule protein n=2 Tax=Gongylonema pulchrum TaxID=637853 RepID=A0A183DG97_9BILA
LNMNLTMMKCNDIFINLQFFVRHESMARTVDQELDKALVFEDAHDDEESHKNETEGSFFSLCFELCE